MTTKNNVMVNSFLNLKNYCESEKFKGWHPYDGLNSKVFQALQMDKVQFFRLAWIQLFKRNPINLRSVMLVSKEYNPKGLGLFLTGYCNLYASNPQEKYREKIVLLADEIIKLKTTGFSGACWGYNFDWQSRAFFLPKGTPTVVATTFIAYALMDAYEITHNNEYLDVALSSAEFIMKDLNRTQKEEGFIFSYSPFDDTCVYNASLLGSKLLARIYSYTKDKDLLEAARGSVLACVNAQREDGAWIYGELSIQNWVDSFHTGYNLECIVEYQKYSGDISFQDNIDKGLKYYLDNFFLADGTPKYYDNKTYPIDVHAPAQLISTLYRLNVLKEQKELVDKVLKWTIENMQDNKGYFYYQLKQGISSKIPYMRWAQAWMFYAFSFYFKEFENDK
jgi:rhamnogalacturonyl hydrolase YesR